MNRFPGILSSSLLVITGMLQAIGASVQAENRTTKDGLPWYEIEVLVFANTDQKGLDTETWGHNSPMKNVDQIISLDFPGNSGSRADLPDSIKATQNLPNAGKPTKMPEPFVFLPSSEFRLMDYARKLGNSKRFEPLLHIAWRQPTEGPEKSVPVFVYSGMDNPQSINTLGSNDSFEGPRSQRFYGLIRMSVSRYLHVETDLHLRSPVVQQEYVMEQPTTGFFSGTQEPVEKLINRNLLLDFRLEESRRMRSKEIHYYDHPMFGVIVQVTPYEFTSG